jgi:DNA polymerase delta subunit 1
VRRDNCLLVRQVIETVLEKILMQRDVQGAVKYVQGMISDLLMNKLDFSQLVITKGFTKEAESYGVKMAHIELAMRMRLRRRRPHRVRHHQGGEERQGVRKI